MFIVNDKKRLTYPYAPSIARVFTGKLNEYTIAKRKAKDGGTRFNGLTLMARVTTTAGYFTMDSLVEPVRR